MPTHAATGPWGVGEACPGYKTYSYDKNGNRTCNGESGSAANYTYSSTSNRLDTSAHPSYSYDDNGSITADGLHTYGYSDANRLATVDGGGTSYDYDGEGRRVRKVGTQTAYFFYDPSGRILTELRINSAVYGTARYGQDYVYLPDGPLARLDWSDVPNPNYYPCNPKPPMVCPPPRLVIADLLYFHTDQLGTPIAMSNETGELVWKAEYTPFGELFSNAIAEVDNKLRFPGQYFDAETGLHQNWFRDYDPKMGRYVEADPIGLDADPHLYNYVSNNPLRWFDVQGLYQQGDVIFRRDPTNPDREDVAFIWDDPTPSADGNGGADPYAGWMIARHWKPGRWSRGSDDTYRRRWQEWQRVNPTWTRLGEAPTFQCYTLVNAMTGYRNSGYLGDLKWGPRDLEYWRTKTRARRQ